MTAPTHDGMAEGEVATIVFPQSRGCQATILSPATKPCARRAVYFAKPFRGPEVELCKWHVSRWHRRFHWRSFESIIFRETGEMKL